MTLIHRYMFECIIKAIKQNGILKLIRIMLEYLGIFSCNGNKPALPVESEPQVYQFLYRHIL